MPVFSLSKLLEKHKSMHYLEFIDYLKTQYKSNSSEIKFIKNRDIKELMERQLKTLSTFIFSIENGLMNNTPFCDESISEILKPIAEYYVKGHCFTKCVN